MGLGVKRFIVSTFTSLGIYYVDFPHKANLSPLDLYNEFKSLDSLLAQTKQNYKLASCKTYISM